MSGLEHQAVLYQGPDEFLALTLPFIREGIEAGDPIVAVTPRANLENLREALGDDAGAVSLHESSDWYVSPGKAFASCLGFVVQHAGAPCVRAIGELVWPAGWQTGVAEYAHYESVFNVIAKDAPIRVICPYDVGALPEEIVEHARATHPELRTIDGLHDNPDYVDPDAYCAHLVSRSEPVGSKVRRFPLTADLEALCLAIKEEAIKAGVDSARVPELVFALHEVAANALRHGKGSGTVTTWIEDRAFVCDVENDGEGLSETTAGYVPFDPATERGRGLWLIRQVWDYVEVRSRAGRTSVRVHVRRHGV